MAAKIPTLERERSDIWSNLFLHIDRRMLESDFDGDFKFDYNHAVFWPMLEEHWKALQAAKARGMSTVV